MGIYSTLELYFNEMAVTISTIISYKFTSLSRRAIDAMLGTKFQDTGVYREAIEEGREAERLEMALKMLQEGAT
jgi:predicted transposase YdaD